MKVLMSCSETKALLSQYLDGVMTGTEMQAVAMHLEQCSDCRREFVGLRRTQQATAKLGRRHAPPELALQIRLKLSREASRTPSRRMQAFMVHLQNAVHAFMVPATAGAVAAVLLFCLLLGSFSLPAQLLASDDGYLSGALYTPPELASAPFGMTLQSHAPGLLMVEATVAPDGRVQDYRVIDGADQGRDMRDLKNLLIFTTFRPAMTFGHPTTGRVVISFAKINVRG